MKATLILFLLVIFSFTTFGQTKNRRVKSRSKTVAVKREQSQAEILDTIEKVLGQNREGWFLYAYTKDGRRSYYQKSSIKRRSSFVRVWLEDRTKPEKVDTVGEILSRTLEEINCSEVKTRSLAEVSYREGRLLNSSDTPNAKFTFIIPDTIGYELYKVVCLNK